MSTIISNRASLLMLKPDAIERGLEPRIKELVASEGLLVTRQIKRRLTAADVRLLDYRNLRSNTPLQFAVGCQYLTRGPIEAWLVEGPDAIGRALLVKAVVRANFGDTDLANILHSAEDEAELQAQTRVLFSEFESRVSGEDPQVDDVDFVRVIKDAIRVCGTNSPAIGESELCGVLLHDHNCLSVDDTVARLIRALQNISFTTAVRHAIAAKIHGKTEVFAGSLGDASRINLALDEQELWVSYRAPHSLAI
jgi:nucleoside diphosphate kinase